MYKEDRLSSLLMSYVVVCTCINGIMFILGCLFMPEQRFGYQAFLAPLVYAAISMIPVAAGEFFHPKTLKGQIVQQAAQLAGIEILMFLFIFGFSNLARQPLALLVSMAFGIALIYVVSIAVLWLLQRHEASELTRELHQYQKNHEES